MTRKSNPDHRQTARLPPHRRTPPFRPAAPPSPPSTQRPARKGHAARHGHTAAPYGTSAFTRRPGAGCTKQRGASNELRSARSRHYAARTRVRPRHSAHTRRTSRPTSCDGTDRTAGAKRQPRPSQPRQPSSRRKSVIVNAARLPSVDADPQASAHVDHRSSSRQHPAQSWHHDDKSRRSRPSAADIGPQYRSSWPPGSRPRAPRRGHRGPVETSRRHPGAVSASRPVAFTTDPRFLTTAERGSVRT